MHTHTHRHKHMGHTHVNPPQQALEAQEWQEQGDTQIKTSGPPGETHVPPHPPDEARSRILRTSGAQRGQEPEEA